MYLKTMRSYLLYGLLPMLACCSKFEEYVPTPVAQDPDVEIVVQEGAETEEETTEDPAPTEPPTEDPNTEEPPTEETPPIDPPTTNAELVFKSGFEGVSLSGDYYGYKLIEGTDDDTGFTWPIPILGSDFGGIHTINDDGGAAIDNSLETVVGPYGNTTTALFQRVNYDVQVTQSPYQINNIKENPEDLYISYWMKTDATSVRGNDTWRAIWTYKTKNYASYTDGFRMIAFMATDYQGRPYWSFQGDTSPTNPVWAITNFDVPLIFDEWFKVEYHLKWSAGADGYASMKVNGQLIAEHYGPTTSNNDDLDFMMLTQVYGSNYPMHQWVDDVEIWYGVPQPQ